MAARADTPAPQQPFEVAAEPSAPRPRSSTRTTIAIAVAVVMVASVLAGAAYLVISNIEEREPARAATVDPRGKSTPASPALTDETLDERRSERRKPETVADVRAAFSSHQPRSMTPYLYQVSSDRSFAEAVRHHDTLKRELDASVFADDAEAALIMHKNGRYFCNVVLWKPPIRPSEWVMETMRNLLGEGAMLRTAATYCVCPQVARVERPDRDARIEVVWCHDEDYGVCPLPD